MKELPFKMIVETEIEKWRRDTFWEKEPETIAWIDDMEPGEILFDVGANIGIYTLYAASRGVRVIAIEPVFENFSRLVENIELNGFTDAFPFYAGCAADTGIGRIMVNNTEIGASGSQITNVGRAIPVYALDGFGAGNKNYHIKIDTDGNELDIIAGAYDLIERKEPKSLLVELNSNQDMQIIGYTRDNKYNTMTPHSRERRQREGIKAENVVFTRV